MTKATITEQSAPSESMARTSPQRARPQAPTEVLLVALLVALGLALFVALLYFPLLFTNRVLASGDILLYFYPYRDYAAAALREGRIPLWNPYLFNGVPFLANPQAAVLYPLHWPLSWLPVTKQIYWSAALHSWLLGYGGYQLARRLALHPWAGAVVALVLAGSGFYGGLIGHINQMNGAAWLPWALLALTGIHTYRQLPGRSALVALLVALMVLAGHTQTAYINLFGIGLWIVWRAFMALPAWRANWATLRQLWQRLAPPLLAYGIGVALAVLIAAAQLLPTLELSELGLRSGGLSYGDVSSFSLRPTRLPWTLLPSYGLVELGTIFGVGYTEFVGYVGTLGLLLALLGLWRGTGPARGLGLFFAALGLFLALGRWNPVYYLLYQIVPGFDLFRVPARWMMLYTVGMALLAGTGLAWLGQMVRRRAFAVRLRLVSGLLPGLATLALVLLAIDLLWAAQALPHAHPTAPQAVYGTRTAPAHLLTDPVRSALDPAAMGRFLGMSTITYDPGDMADWQRVLRTGEQPQLSAAAFNEFIIGLKIQELLVPNLPLLWRVPAVDGFDGGVLPLQRYNKLLTLLVPPDELVPDGRLREQIDVVPDTDLLGLLNVQYLITDKVRDRWFEDLFYDRQVGARLTAAAPQTTMRGSNTFAATHVDLIGYVDAPLATDANNRPVATVRVTGSDGQSEAITVTAGSQPGAHLADGALDSPAASQAAIPVALRDVDAGRQEYRVRLPLAQPTIPVTITVALMPAAPPIVVQAVTLYDADTRMFTPLLPSDRGEYRLVHSGDVKIYENLAVRPRAYFVEQVIPVADSDMALAELRENPAIRQGRAAVAEGLDTPPFAPRTSGQPPTTASATIVAYAPESITIQSQNERDAFLVLSDSYFPGWRATINGTPTPIHATNVFGRGIVVPAGKQTIVFSYWPASWQRGLWLSALGLLLWLLLLGGQWRIQQVHSPLHNH